MEQDFEGYVNLNLTASYLADGFDLLTGEVSKKKAIKTGKEINSELKDLRKLFFTKATFDLKNLTVDLVKENLTDFGKVSLEKIATKLKKQVKGNPKDIGPKFLVQNLNYLKNVKGKGNLKKLSQFFAYLRDVSYRESARYDENFEIRKGMAPLDIESHYDLLRKHAGMPQLI